MKDNFSNASHLYAKYRPVYPAEMLRFIVSLVKENNQAWDCGTGNGQVAQVLSEYFTTVQATDISTQQIQQAAPNNKIVYSVSRAELTTFPDNSFDLITVAQAIHWFDFDLFYAEVKRTAKPEAILAVFGYGFFQISSEVDAIITEFYDSVIGVYWDYERRYLDENYQTIPFPFHEISHEDFKMELNWTAEQILGYLETWSAVKHYQKAHQKNPLDLIRTELKQVLSRKEHHKVVFPIFLRLARIEK
ncbi:class I SAM-dependent methyltransferase [soil metagenome]